LRQTDKLNSRRKRVLKKIAFLLIMASVLAILFAGCPKKQPPPPPPPPPPVAVETTKVEPPPPPPPPPPAPLQLTTIHFDFDKYNLRDDARDIMGQNGEALKTHASAIIKIEGHCDERGSVEYNMALGEKRAATARDYLVSYGISKDKISIISYGKSRPVDTGKNETAWAKNRRADFDVVSQ
jgi:peptidoglycan-associated lipoprotein